MTTKTSLSKCSHLVDQILLAGAQDVLGAEKLNHVLGELSLDNNAAQVEQPASELSMPLDDAGSLLQMLEGIYGVPGGRGLALRIGRAAFKYGLKQFGDQAGLFRSEYRLLPAPRRIATGLNILAQVIAQECNDPISVTDGGAYWLWRSESCPLCHDHQSADPCCHVVVGLLQEFTAWAGGGRFYPVTEIACRANGGAVCEFRVEKKPLD